MSSLRSEGIAHYLNGERTHLTPNIYGERTCLTPKENTPFLKVVIKNASIPMGHPLTNSSTFQATPLQGVFEKTPHKNVTCHNQILICCYFKS